MPYWIHEDGEVIGPMRAIDVLRRARSTARVSDGQDWFQIDAGPGCSDHASGDSDSGVFEHPSAQRARG